MNSAPYDNYLRMIILHMHEEITKKICDIKNEQKQPPEMFYKKKFS